MKKSAKTTEKLNRRHLKSSQKTQETQKNRWYCGACGGSSSTGCLSSTGECYR